MADRAAGRRRRAAALARGSAATRAAAAPLCACVPGTLLLRSAALLRGTALLLGTDGLRRRLGSSRRRSHLLLSGARSRIIGRSIDAGAMPMRTLARMLICTVLAVSVLACVPIGVRSTSLPYAPADAPAVAVPAR